MSAQTRPIETLAQLTSLYASAVDLIQRGARDPQMTNSLTFALQLFKENRLGEILTKSSKALLNLALARQICSYEIREHFHFPPQAVSYCRQRGIEYVGELFYVKRDERTDQGRKQSGNLIAVALLQLGLPVQADPIRDWNWEPPYWNTHHFSSLLKLPITGKLTEIRFAHTLSLLRNMHARKEVCVGHLLLAQERKLSKSETRLISGGDLRDLQHTLSSLGLTQSGVRAGMLVPPLWSPGESVYEQEQTVLRALLNSLWKVEYHLQKAGYPEPYENIGMGPGEFGKGLAAYYSVGQPANHRIVWVYPDYSMHEQTAEDVPF